MNLFQSLTNAMDIILDSDPTAGPYSSSISFWFTDANLTLENSCCWLTKCVSIPFKSLYQTLILMFIKKCERKKTIFMKWTKIRKISVLCIFNGQTVIGNDASKCSTSLKISFTCCADKIAQWFILFFYLNLECFIGISTTEKNCITAFEKIKIIFQVCLR